MYFVAKVKKKLTLATHICVPGCIEKLSIENGKIEYELPQLQSLKAIFSCNNGYVLIGNKVRTCFLSFAWTGHAPMCQREFFIDVKWMVIITNLQLVIMFISYFLDMTDNDLPN